MKHWYVNSVYMVDVQQSLSLFFITAHREMPVFCRKLLHLCYRVVLFVAISSSLGRSQVHRVVCTVYHRSMSGIPPDWIPSQVESSFVPFPALFVRNRALYCLISPILYVSSDFSLCFVGLCLFLDRRLKRRHQNLVSVVAVSPSLRRRLPRFPGLLWLGGTSGRSPFTPETRPFKTNRSAPRHVPLRCRF